MKIQEIRFCNYKAFYGDNDSNVIHIPNGENVLIYGENGSGKSSVYEGLRNLFLASASQGKFSRHIAVPEFIPDPENPLNQIQQLGYIKVTFDNGKEVVFGQDGNVEGDPDIFEANKTNSFLSYKELIRTYFVGDPLDEDTFQKNLAELIIKDILANTVNSGTGQSYLNSYEELWSGGRGKKPYREDKINILKKFDSGFQEDIANINLILNELLTHFFPDLKVDLKAMKSNIVYDKQNRPVFRVDLKCWHFDMLTNENDESHLTILNEARLSALALCIFLAGMITKDRTSQKLKMLFFDDIFVGLDLSNRRPFLDILRTYKRPHVVRVIDHETGGFRKEIEKNEIEGVEVEYRETDNFFDAFQIFITTHDLHWFEHAKIQLNEENWLNIEMFSHFNVELNFETPLILSPSLDYYHKARLFFDKNKDFKDYPAAANYLRKECELQFKRILFGKYLLKNGDKGTTVQRQEIEDLRQSFERLLSEINVDYTPFKELISVVKTTLNPLSHDNLGRPIYKSDLIKAFEFIDLLRGIERKRCVEAGTKIKNETSKPETIRITHLKVATDVYQYKFQGVNYYSLIELKPLKYYENGEFVQSLSKIDPCSPQDAYNMIQYDFMGLENASEHVDVFAEFYFDNGYLLNSQLV